MRLSVKVNEVFGDEPPIEEMVHRAGEAGAEAVGFWPWHDESVETFADAADAAGVGISYLSGGSPAVEGPEFRLAAPATSDQAVAEIKRGISVARSVGSDSFNVIPGLRDEALDPAVQHTTIVRGLRQVAPAAEAADVTLLVEPINRSVDHPGVYLDSSYEGYKIVEAVDSPNVQLLYDVYHQQITEGNLIANLRAHADEIGHVHVADVPGRHEPGTGEINYSRVLSALAETGYDGYVECEFFPSGEPEAAIQRVGELVADAG